MLAEATYLDNQATTPLDPRLTPERHGDPVFPAQPRYWVAENEVAAKLAAKGWDRGWLLGWRDICRSRDERTVIAAAIPRTAVGDKFLLALGVMVRTSPRGCPRASWSCPTPHTTWRRTRASWAIPVRRSGGTRGGGSC